MPGPFLQKAASVLIKHLGSSGVKTFGGVHWWQYRHVPLKCEWIEMKRDLHSRQADPTKSPRVILYIHGGAYYFGSVDEHRYQIQRHARKLGGRAFAANYRLAPQFPAPCGIQDNLACYLYLLTLFRPQNIILSGDSAGAGQCLAILTVLRDRGIPLPAGCVLISPWVDLNHSFPSILADSRGDYIPPSGFQHKPSIVWPPPTTDDIAAARRMAFSESLADNSSDKSRDSNDDVNKDSAVDTGLGYSLAASTSVLQHHHIFKVDGNNTSIAIDNKIVTIKDQIQLYATNEQISHPLVSPVIAGSLGGLCPLFILGGGAELLRDEIIYIAHKAACPRQYPPMDYYLDRDPRERENLQKYPPTLVHLQMYDDCCHVTPTISMCRPAKYMYRAIANFSLWALARFGGSVQMDIAHDLKKQNLIDLHVQDSDSDASSPTFRARTAQATTMSEVTVTGVEPEFIDNMIRERISVLGFIRPMEPVAEMYMLHLRPDDIGVIKEGPVKRWMAARASHDQKYQKRKTKLQKQRAREYVEAEQHGFVLGEFDGEKVPPAAAAGRSSLKAASRIVKMGEGKKKGMVNTMFSKVMIGHDEEKINAEQRVQHAMLVQ